MPLTMLTNGQESTVKKITGKDEVRTFLKNLGFVEGGTVSVVKLHGEGALRRRIMDMGITRGTSIYVRKVAPLGDPVEITIRGYELSIRKGDADCIEVT